MATAKKGGNKSDAPVPEKSGKKLSAEIIARLKDEAGIDATSEEDARQKLIKRLKSNGVTGVENDALLDLLDMVAAFPSAGEEEAEEEAAPPKAVKKPTSGKKSKEEEEPEEETDEEGDEEEEEVEEGEEDEEEVKTPVKKGGTKKPAKASKKQEEEEDEEEEEEDVTQELIDEVNKMPVAAGKAKAGKKASTSKPRAHKLLGKRWKDLTDAEKTKALKPLKKLLPEDKFKINLLDQSIMVKFIGKTNEHSIFKWHLLRLQDDGKLEGIFVTHRFKTPDEFMAYLPEDISAFTLKKGDSCSYIHPFHQDRVMELLTDTNFLEDSLSSASKADNKMATNHAKLKEQLEGSNGKAGNKTGTPAKKGNAKPTKKEEEEPEEEEEEEEEVPAPTPKKKTVIITTKADPKKGGAKAPAKAK